MVYQMVRLASVPTNIPSGTTLLPYVKTEGFRYDYSLLRASGRHKDSLAELWRLVEILRTKGKVAPEPAYCLHKMNGEWKGSFNCHLEGDVVLIFTYGQYNGAEHLILARLGTHSYLRIA